MKSVALGDLAEFINGAAFKPEDWGDEGARIIRIQNLNDPSKLYNRTTRHVPKKYEIPPGTLLVSWSASLGVFEWNEPDTALLNQHIFKVVPDVKKVRQDYLRLMLSKALRDMEKHAHGSTMLHVNRGEFLATEIPVPSLDKQKQVAAILDQADDLRRKRKQALDRLNQLGQAIFYEMFGDPIANDKGFGTKPLKELIQSSRGISYGIVQRGPDQDDGIPVVRISDIVHGKFEAESLVRTTAEISQKYRRTILQGGELLISIRGTVGALARVPEHIHGVNISREVAQIPLLNGVSWRFILFLLRSPEAQRRLVEDVKGVAQSGINLADLRKISIIQPSKPAIEEFEQRILQLERLTDATNLRSCELDGLWSSLQHRAFRGEL